MKETTSPKVLAIPREDAKGLFERVSVRAPYVVLQDLERAGERIYATVLPEVFEAEPGPVSVSEAARHLAVLGACAASVHPDAPGAPQMYQVTSVELRLDPAHRHIEPLVERCHVEAWCVGFDAVLGSARSEGVMVTRDGREIATILVDYQTRAALPREDSAGATSVRDDLGRGRVPVRGKTGREGDAFYFAVEVSPEMCRGHFPALPALPLSIMARCAVHAVRGAARAQGEYAHHPIKEALIELHRFVYTGEHVRFVATGLHDEWTCAARVGEELVASFEVRLSRPWKPQLL